MSTYETRIRGARNRLKEAMEHAPTNEERDAIAALLAELNKLLGVGR